MRERYIAEHMYSEKVRSASTWWTWGLITTHFVLFVLVQTIFEPRKKRALTSDILDIVQRAADKEMDVFQSNMAKLDTSVGRIMQIHSLAKKQESPLETVPFSIMENAIFNIVFWQGLVIGGLVSLLVTR